MGKCNFKTITAVAAAAFFAPVAAMAACAENVVSMRGDFGQVQFSADVADDSSERARGLMFVEEMPALTGMLFVFPRPQRTTFWMRNTLIPLDMVFVGADGVVDHIHPNAIPHDETPIFGGDEIQYVFEINGGMAERLGLSVGDAVQHPSISGDVAWPCPES